MSLTSLLLVVPFAAASWLMTRQVLRFALSRGMLDVPNDRSSHSVPVPRGGGLAIVLATLAGLALSGAAGWMSWRLVLAFCGAVPIAFIGWLDDRMNVTPLARIGVHIAAAIWAVLSLGGYQAMSLGSTSLRLGALGSMVAVVAIVWATNLYNFMDGIDGIAAGEGVVAGAVGAVVMLAAGSASLAWVSLLLAASSAGFLWWNWSPAKIFMGDVGSGFLGFSFGVLALASERVAAVPALVWIILLGVFVFDATVTLVRRAVRGQRVYAAHRSHAYQRAVRAGLSHARVSMSVVLCSVALGALALMAQAWPSLTPVLLVVGGLGLTLIYIAVERLRPMQSTEQ